MLLSRSKYAFNRDIPKSSTSPISVCKGIGGVLMDIDDLYLTDLALRVIAQDSAASSALLLLLSRLSASLSWPLSPLSVSGADLTRRHVLDNISNIADIDPSSIEDVQISPLRMPPLKRFSASMRVSFESEPWCTPIGMPSILNLEPSISADSLVLTNMRVDLWLLTISWIIRRCEPFPVYTWVFLKNHYPHFRLRANTLKSKPVQSELPWRRQPFSFLTGIVRLASFPTVAERPSLWNSPATSTSRSRAIDIVPLFLKMQLMHFIDDDVWNSRRLFRAFFR